MAAFLAARRRLRGGDAGRQRGRLGGRRQARHRHRIGAELRARILPDASLAAEQKIVFDWSELDRAARRVAPGGPAHRLHQRLLRSPASRPRQAAGQARAACDRLVVGLNTDASVRRLKGDGRPVQDRGRARRGPGGARSGRSRGAVRRGHAARADPPRAADGAGQGRGLSARPGGRTRGGGGDGGEVILVDLVPGHSTSDIVARSRARVDA